MKKKRILQTVLIASLTLIVGFLAGVFIVGFPPEAYVLPGSIGKADRYRNVQITENDILLRNELLGDAEKQELYKNYLNYYYIRAMRTSNVLNRSVASARQVPEFQGTFLDYAEGLSGFANYLDAARTDILKALDVIVNLEANPRVPVVEYLNQANNVIARMRQYDNVLVDFMIAIESFMDLRPDTDFPGLADAHDMLVMSLMESALVTQSKPLLKMLDKKQLANNEEGVNELLMSMELGTIYLVNQFNYDINRLEGDGTFTLGSQQLDNVVSNAVTLFNVNNISSFIDSNSQINSAILQNAAKLDAAASSEQLGKIIFYDSEMLNYIRP